MNPVTEPGLRLQQLRRRQQVLAQQVLDLGFLQKGSVVVRHTRCGAPGCRCHADPPQLHGPYWQWSHYGPGRTVTRRVTASQAAVYQQAVDNHRRLEEIIAEMEELGTEATEILAQVASSGDSGAT